MSNGTGQSKAPYIIVCGGRIELEAANKPEEMVVAASNAAVRLTSYYGDRLTEADTLPISNLQHEMMEGMAGYNKHHAKVKADEMFALLDALERKYQSEHSY